MANSWILLAPVVLGGIAFTVVLIVYAFIQSGKQQLDHLNSVYGRLAKNFSGELHKARIGTNPSVRFVHNGVPVLIAIESLGNEAGPYLCVNLGWPDARLRCEVYPRQIFHRLVMLLGMQGVTTGDTSFDDRFVVTGNQPEVIRRLLSSTARSLIIELSKVHYDNDVYVAIRNGSLMVRKVSQVTLFDTLLRTTELSLALFDEAVRAVGADVAEIDFDVIPGSAEPMCPVCGEKTRDDTVYCRACQTPHHAECWQYYGACSTYGCRGTAFNRRPPAQRRSRPRKMET